MKKKIPLSSWLTLSQTACLAAGREDFLRRPSHGREEGFLPLCWRFQRVPGDHGGHGLLRKDVLRNKKCGRGAHFFDATARQGIFSPLLSMPYTETYRVVLPLAGDRLDPRKWRPAFVCIDRCVHTSGRRVEEWGSGQSLRIFLKLSLSYAWGASTKQLNELAEKVYAEIR